jgi:hypothetical protein
MADQISPDDFDRLVISHEDLARLDRVKLRGKKKTPSRRSSAAKVKLYRQRQRMGQIVAMGCSEAPRRTICQWNRRSVSS